MKQLTLLTASSAAASFAKPRNLFLGKPLLGFFRGKKRKGHGGLKAKAAAIAMPVIPEAKSNRVRRSWVRNTVSGFFSDSFAALRKFFDYVRHPSHAAIDFNEVLAEVSGKYYASAAGLLVVNTAIAELAACAGRYAGYLGETFGAYGVATGIVLGDHITAFVVGQIAWFLTTAKALGVTTVREKLFAFGKIEPEVLSTWARGFILTVPFDVVQFFSFAKMYSYMGAGAISNFANGVLGAAGALAILFSLTINIDMVARIAKKLSLPERKSKNKANLQPSLPLPPQKESLPSQTPNREE